MAWTKRLPTGWLKQLRVPGGWTIVVPPAGVEPEPPRWLDSTLLAWVSPCWVEAGQPRACLIAPSGRTTLKEVWWWDSWTRTHGPYVVRGQSCDPNEPYDYLQELR